MPDDIFYSLWTEVVRVIESGVLCWNVEIAEELKSIPGRVGACLSGCKECCYEVDKDNWPVQEYLENVERMREFYRQYIAEYNNRKSTVSLNDVSIVALGKTLKLPVISMEAPNPSGWSTVRMRIPALCEAESVMHLEFNDFLRREGIRV
jgi:hypothetical protein